MTLPEKHYTTTKKLIKKIPVKNISDWLLCEGYYPEQYVVPPTYRVSKFKLKNRPNFEIECVNSVYKFEPIRKELIKLSFPKTQLTDRTFGIIHPDIYHDIVWYLCEEWKLIIDKIFRKNSKIYTYSFPIPVSKKDVGNISNLRSGRMIYEFLEMAEKDLVAEAYNYKYILKTDIANFYPSLYTHSIAWALHTKKVIRTKGNKTNFNKFVGLVLDKLFQNSNDGCTNGIAIGPAVSDIICEIVLSEVDFQCSQIISKENIDFLGVRFKDDYRFLCHSEQDANYIIKALQKQLGEFNLHLNEKKCRIEKLPEGLFREWTAAYIPYSLRYKNIVTYKTFENSFRGTLSVDKSFEGTGVVDKFLSELYNDKHELKLKFNNHSKNILKTVSLLLLLKEMRNKSLPQILGIIEQLLKDVNNVPTKNKIIIIIKNLLNEKLKDINGNHYDVLWLIFFVKSNNLFIIDYPKTINSKLILSLKNNRTEFFKPLPSEISIFNTIKTSKKTILLEYLSIFKKS
ncbi:RNA-directed DNA polymerase [Flavobacterium sp. LaA7.5]|nr:RNA-directed DNA polymerase [Flavobacterium salilacus subsp. altitudinum]